MLSNSFSDDGVADSSTTTSYNETDSRPDGERESDQTLVKEFAVVVAELTSELSKYIPGAIKKTAGLVSVIAATATENEIRASYFAISAKFARVASDLDIVFETIAVLGTGVNIALEARQSRLFETNPEAAIQRATDEHIYNERKADPYFDHVYNELFGPTPMPPSI